MSLPPKAPPAYKPVPLRLAAPPVYRPNQVNAPSAQLKRGNQFRLEMRPAPTVYRPQQEGKTPMQPKTAMDCLENRSAPPVYKAPHANSTFLSQNSLPSFSPSGDALVAQPKLAPRLGRPGTTPAPLAHHPQQHAIRWNTPVNSTGPSRTVQRMKSPFDWADPFPDRDRVLADIRMASPPSSASVSVPLGSPSPSVASSITSSGAVPSIDDLAEIDYLPNVLIEHELRGESVKFLKRREWTPPAIGSGNVFATGKVFYQVGSGPITPLTADMVNAHFDSKFQGFTKVRDPDWRYNCGDYATGHESPSLGDVPDIWRHLRSKTKISIEGKSSEEISDIFSDLPDRTYVAAYASHFLKMVVAGSTVTLSQKDGESAVYSKTMTRQEAAAYMAAHSDANNAGLYY